MRIIDADSLPFVLVGPKQGRDQILVRSSNAGTELVGFAASLGWGENPGANAEIEHRHHGYYTGMHSVATGPVRPLSSESDPRKSSYRFCWVGKCDGHAHSRISRIFDMHISEITNVLDKHGSNESSDANDLEWVLAPIVYACFQADRLFVSRTKWIQRRQRKLVIWWALGMGTVAVLALVFALVQGIFANF